MRCRICGFQPTLYVGTAHYYSDFQPEIFDCPECGCRETEHKTVADNLHANLASCYGLQAEMGEKAKALFRKGDLENLRHFLSANSRYKFIVDTLSDMPISSKILEWGCSRGYLSSYSILQGRDIIGADISETAVTYGNANFGPHFFGIDSPEIAARGPYDVIYHVGTIGCVANPIAMTRNLIRLLKPDGKLIFNAPNKDACWLRNQLWIDFSPPPDVVTLFKPGFWKRYFSEVAEVQEEVIMCSPHESFRIQLRRLFKPWKAPTPLTLRESLGHYTGKNRQHPTFALRLWNVFEECTYRAALKLELADKAPLMAAPYDFYVTMTRA